MKKTLERIKTHFDSSTGEITRETQQFVIKGQNEEDYIKVYYNTLLTFKGISTILTPVLLAMGEHMTYANSKQGGQRIKFDAYVKEAICYKCGMGQDRLNQLIRIMIENDVIRRIFKKDKDGNPTEASYRGLYEVNPFIMGKGDWNDIKALRTDFNYVDGTAVTIYENDKAMKCIQERKAKRISSDIEGQLSLDDLLVASETMEA